MAYERRRSRGEDSGGEEGYTPRRRRAASTEEEPISVASDEEYTPSRRRRRDASTSEPETTVVEPTPEVAPAKLAPPVVAEVPTPAPPPPVTTPPTPASPVVDMAPPPAPSGGYSKNKFHLVEEEDLDDANIMDLANIDPAIFEGKKLKTKEDVLTMMGLAKDLDASDVHISVLIAPSCRVHGEMMQMPGYAALTREETRRIIEVIVDEKLLPILKAKGEIDCSYSVPGVGRFRVNAFRQRNSYSMVARLVNSVVPDPEKLGLPDSLIEMCKKKRGLVLVTGPTGSGKSTTLSVLISIINHTRHGHIITMEDPIEFMHDHALCVVNQREMGPDSDSYSNALRAALRQDPDVLLVGEMRDLDTIETAVTASETGHLVFSTLHTIGAAATIDRILDVFPSGQQNQIRAQLAEVIQCVCSQQLLPKVGGGRVAALEIMIATPAIRNNIREGKISSITSSMQTGKELGMITMDDSIAKLFFDGIIEQKTAIEFAQDTKAMETRLR